MGDQSRAIGELAHERMGWLLITDWVLFQPCQALCFEFEISHHHPVQVRLRHPTSQNPIRLRNLPVPIPRCLLRLPFRSLSSCDCWSILIAHLFSCQMHPRLCSTIPFSKASKTDHTYMTTTMVRFGGRTDAADEQIVLRQLARGPARGRRWPCTTLR